MNDFFTKSMNDLNTKKEYEILEQLNDFISRGLIVIHETEPVIVRDIINNSVKISQKVKLVLKDEEYILKLENEVEALNRKIKIIKNFVNTEVEE